MASSRFVSHVMTRGYVQGPANIDYHVLAQERRMRSSITRLIGLEHGDHSIRT